ncbi:RnfABCDGE type electron transport complex subunit G [Clostridiaceae bacterium HFYG-1003]|nr:RnfABCDGE type electron transport complex subunit G [Clostridiaceae bacterium HFYG-1003]
MLKEKEGMWPALVLTVICIVTAFMLSLAYSATKDKIAANQLGDAEIVMKELMPDADSFKKAEDPGIDGVTGVYEALKGSESLGYIVMSESSGYGGPVPIIVAFKSDKTLAGMSVSKSNGETPGFGKNAEEPAFQDQFKGLAADKEFTFSGEADKTNFDQVSGATVTSVAIKMAMNNALKAVQALGY